MKENLAKVATAAQKALDVGTFETAALIARGCQEAKGSEITALDMKGLSDFADYFIVVSGRSDRQAQGIARRAMEMAEQRGISPVSVEGFDKGHWILIDFGEVVLHVFYGPMREHYNLEALWSRAKQVDLFKPASARSRLVRQRTGTREGSKRSAVRAA